MTKNEIVKAESGGMPAALAEEMQRDAGAGTSSDQDDVLVPLIYILQAQSPQCDKRGPEYIEGAESGSIWLRNAPAPIVDGEKGMLFQPCYFTKDYVEWRPRGAGGGFVARHAEEPDDVEEKPDPENPQRMKRIRSSNGNEIVFTRYHVGFVFVEGSAPMPYVIPMASSGHTVSRQWMFMMNAKKVGSGQVAPSFACLYLLKTRQRSNPSGTWFTWKIEDAGWVQSRDDYERGRALFEAFTSGDKAVEAPEHQEATTVPDEDAAM